jgi:Uma2 family endonuclease
MGAVLKPRPMTPDEYLEFEEGSEVRHEYFHGELVAMAGAGLRHNAILMNLATEIGGRIKGSPCQGFVNDQRVEHADAHGYYYPDLAIVCGPPRIGQRDRMALANPQVIIEVLSPSTELRDRGTKFRAYQRIESLRELVLVSAGEPCVEVFTRQDGGGWLLQTTTGLEGSMRLESIPGLSIPLADIYLGVTFDPEESPPKPSPPE